MVVDEKMLDHDKNYEQKDKILVHNIQNGELARFRFERVLRFDYCLLTFSMMNIFLSILYYQADYFKKYKIANTCLKFTDICTSIQILLTIFRYLSQIDLEKSQKILQEEQNVISSGKIYQIIFEICILIIQPSSILKDVNVKGYNIYNDFTFDYKLNYYLVVLGFSKIFIAARVFLLNQEYMSPRSNRLCRMYGSQSNYLYSIKCLFKDSPIKLISFVFAFSIVIFSLCLRIAQRHLSNPQFLHKCALSSNENLNSIKLIDNFGNAIWVTFITMTTVGYGDYFPRTVFGRAIDVVLVIWGTFIVSLMVVVLTNTLNMDQAQKRALIVLNRLEAKKQLKQAAAFLITYSCRKYLINKKISQGLRLPLSDNQNSDLEKRFMKHLSNFQNVHRSIRSMYEIDDVYQEMTRQFQVISDQMGKVLADQQQAILKLTIDQKEKQKKVNNTTEQKNKNKKKQSIRHSIIKQTVKKGFKSFKKYQNEILGEEDWKHWLGVQLITEQKKIQPQNKTIRNKAKEISVIKQQVQEQNILDQLHWF